MKKLILTWLICVLVSAAILSAVVILTIALWDPYGNSFFNGEHFYWIIFIWIFGGGWAILPFYFVAVPETTKYRLNPSAYSVKKPKKEKKTGDILALRAAALGLESLYSPAAPATREERKAYRETKLLFFSLFYKDDKTKRSALKELSKVHYDFLRWPLILILGDENYFVGIEAADAMAGLDNPPIALLIAILQSGKDKMRERAAYALGRLGDQKALEPLIKALEDGSRDVRRIASDALAELKNPRAIEPIFRLMDETKRFERSREIQHFLISLAYDLAELGDPRAVEPLLGILEDGDRDVRIRAIKALAQFGAGRAVEPLIEMMKANDWQQKSETALALGRLKDLRATPALIEAFAYRHEEDFLSDWRVWKAAAWALGELSDPGAMGPPEKLFADNYIDVKKMVAEALGKINDPAVIGQLIHMLSYQLSGEVCNAIKDTLLVYKDRITEPLLEALRSNNDNLCLRAINILGEIKDPRTIDPIEDFIVKTRNNYHRERAQRVLDEIKEAHALNTNHRD